jgi:hypothetical protein
VRNVRLREKSIKWENLKVRDRFKIVSMKDKITVRRMRDGLMGSMS